MGTAAQQNFHLLGGDVKKEPIKGD